MHSVNRDQLSEGLIVAQDIFSKEGQLIVRKNSLLTKQMISHLSFYHIDSVFILDSEIPESVKATLDQKQRVEDTHLEKILASKEFQTFRDKYKETASIIETSFNDIIFRNKTIDGNDLIVSAVDLFNKDTTTYSLFSMIHAMKQMDSSTIAHSLNVSIISRLIGSWIGYNEYDLNQLTLAGVLHDIGKCKIPEDILYKPSKLSAQEYEMVKMHTTFGYDVVKNQDLDSRIKNAVLYHHERHDGSGYPQKLTGSQIADFESIVAISDVYDAMTSSRCYRSALCPFEVIASFEQDGLSKYHPQYILIFLEKIANSYLNSEVLLNDGSRARIICNTPALTRPVVQDLSSGNIIRLQEVPDLYIEAII